MADAFLALLICDVEPDRLTEYVGERLCVPLCGPQLELGVAAGPQTDDEAVLLLA
jgi:hypothetical protein